MRQVRIEVQLPLIEVSFQEKSGKIGITSNINDLNNNSFDSITLIDASIDDTSVIFDCPDSTSVATFLATTTSGTYQITRVIEANINTSTYLESTVTPVTESMISDIDRTIINSEIYQDRSEDYITSHIDSKESDKKIIKSSDENIYNDISLNLETSNIYYNECVDDIKNTIVKIDSSDIELCNSIYILGGDPEKGLDGSVLLKAINVVENTMLPMGWSYEEYLLFPLDKNGNTLLPNVIINDDESESTSNGDGYVSRITAQNMIDKRKTWDFVKLLWQYLLILLLKFVCKVIKKLQVVPLNFVVSLIIKMLNRWWKSVFKTVSKYESKKMDDLQSISSSESENSDKIEHHLYINVSSYTDINDSFAELKYIYALAFKPKSWIEKYWGKSRTLIYNISLNTKRLILSQSLKTIKLDYINDYIKNGELKFGTDILTTEYHNGRIDTKKYEAILSIVEDIISNLDNLKAINSSLLESFYNCVSSGTSFSSLLQQLNEVMPINLYVSKDNIITSGLITDELKLSIYESLNNNIIKYISEGNIFDNDNVYIDPKHALIFIDSELFKSKYLPSITTNDIITDQVPFNNSISGVKTYNSPQKEKAAMYVMKEAQSNKTLKKKVSEYIVNKNNMEIQTSSAVACYKTGNVEYDTKVKSDLEKTDIGKRKLILVDKINGK